MQMASRNIPVRGGPLLQTSSAVTTNSSSSALKGKPMVGVVFKLGDWGIDNNERFLKLNKKGLSVYRNKPETAAATTVEQVEALGKDYKPKYCVPLEAIVAVDEITEEERTKHKKYFKSSDA